MKHFLISISIGFLVACGEKEAEHEVISFEEFAGTSGNADSLASADTAMLETNEIPGLSGFVRGQLSLYDTLTGEGIHSLDRFGFSTSKKLDFKAKFQVPYGKTNQVTPVASLFYYTFADSIKTNNAFYNWLDCFGKDCTPVSLREDLSSIKTPPMLALVYDTTIVALEYKCEHEKNDWDSFEDSLVNKLGKNYRYRIEVGCGGPLRWK